MTGILSLLFAFYTQYSYAADLLKMFQSPFVAALGGDHVISCDSLHSPIFNPAQIQRTKQLAISHYSFHGGFLNMENIYIGGAAKKSYNFSFFLSYLHSVPIELTGLADTALGPVEDNIYVKKKDKYTALYLSAQLSYIINSRLKTGISTYFFSEHLPDYPIKGIGINTGIYVKEGDNISLGAGVKNILGIKIEKDSKDVPAPEISMGVSAAFERLHYVFTLIAEYGHAKSYGLFTNKKLTLYASFGFAYDITRHIQLRAGTGRRGLAMGAGVTPGKFLIDYAIVPSGELGFTHKLSLTYNIE